MKIDLKRLSISAAIIAALSLCVANAASREELLKPVNRFYDSANNTYGVAGENRLLRRIYMIICMKYLRLALCTA